MAVEHMHPGGVPVDDPQVEQAMCVYDNLNPGEQREVFQSMYRAVAAFGRTSNIDHLVRFAESIEGMVRLEAQPGFRQALRDGRKTPGRPDEAVDITEVIKQLQE